MKARYFLYAGMITVILTAVHVNLIELPLWFILLPIWLPVFFYLFMFIVALIAVIIMVAVEQYQARKLKEK